ncbi:DUF6221 family protein [Kitasatospora sp. NPDC089797]|uniref:DUF6221 family protein n=1 Tax=Kitasatospora sp. NPDC089797 TaxID=3155298 RepID=UPI0034491FF5
MSTDLVEFLHARFDDDEQAAHAALGTNELAQPAGQQARWVRQGDQIWSQGRSDVPVVGKTWARPAEHIVRHDPARVLSEVDAKRRVLADAASFTEDGQQAVFQLLALPYADHPDYRPEWAPGTSA